MNSLAIRPEAPDDSRAIFRVHSAAFPTDAEARLVNALRSAGRLTLSLVAERGREIVGHIAFSPVHLAGAETNPLAMGLAPVAVLPRGAESRHWQPTDHRGG